MADHRNGGTQVNDTVTVKTLKCRLCGEAGEVTVRKSDLERYREGAYVQEAFPELPADLREQIINGTHPICFKIMFEE